MTAERSPSTAGTGATNHSVVLIPCDENHPDVEGCDYSMVNAATATEQSAARPNIPTTAQHSPQSWGSNRYRISKAQPTGR